MNITITAEANINGKPYKKSVELDLSKANKRLVNMSLLGEIGKGFRYLLIGALRTEEQSKEVV